MLAFYLAAHHPERFPRVVVLDAGLAVVTPATRALLAPTIARLGAVVPSWDEYLAAVRKLPYFQDQWDPAIERYFRNYVRIAPDGSIRQLVAPEAVLAAIEGILIEDWPTILGRIRQPVLLINAQGPYRPPAAAPFLSAEQAKATVAILANGHYVSVSGNHVTMIFGPHARQVAAAIEAFAGGDELG
jgi:pimeloyl-ACP methyl ester carboxylesterase